jgi:hypothetical protein
MSDGTKQKSGEATKLSRMRKREVKREKERRGGEQGREETESATI